MYKNIELNLIIKELKKRELAEKMGIGYNTLLVKLRGERDFTLQEAFMIKEILNFKDDLEILFKKSNKKNK